MLEVSASALPAVALAGAVMPAAPPRASGEGAQVVDFSDVLSGAALCAAGPMLSDASQEPSEPQLYAPDPSIAARHVPTGKIMTGGNQTGKLLPPGKLPQVRKLADNHDDGAEKPGDNAHEPVDPTSNRSVEDHPATSAPETMAAPAQTSAPAGVAPTTAQTLMSQEQRTIAALPDRTRPATLRAPASTPMAPAHDSENVAPASLAATPLAALAIPIEAEAQPATVSGSVVTTAIFEPEVNDASKQANAATLRDGALLQPAMTMAPTSETSTLFPVATARLITAQMTAALQMPLTGATVTIPAPIEIKPVPPKSNIETSFDITVGAASAAVTSRTSLEMPASTTTAAAEHKSTAAIAAPLADAIALRPDLAVPLAEPRSAIPVAAATSAQAAAPQPLDLGALVDRIAEARAAAAPHTVRAALTHEDFGAVSLNLRADASHLHVTLENADPGFAPAVHAAAAATLTGNDSGQREAAQPQSQDRPHAQQQSTAQDAGAANNAASQQQHTPRERAGTGERLARETTQSRRQSGPTDTQADPASPRRSGIYA